MFQEPTIAVRMFSYKLKIVSQTPKLSVTSGSTVDSFTFSVNSWTRLFSPAFSTFTSLSSFSRRETLITLSHKSEIDKKEEPDEDIFRLGLLKYGKNLRGKKKRRKKVDGSRIDWKDK